MLILSNEPVWASLLRCQKKNLGKDLGFSISIQWEEKNNITGGFPNLCYFTSWWFQPNWNICLSKWVHLPQFSGWKQKIFELPPPRIGWLIMIPIINLISVSSFPITHQLHRSHVGTTPMRKVTNNAGKKTNSFGKRATSAAKRWNIPINSNIVNDSPASYKKKTTSPLLTCYATLCFLTFSETCFIFPTLFVGFTQGLLPDPQDSIDTGGDWHPIFIRICNTHPKLT